MAIDYHILKDCKVKEQLKPSELLATIIDRQNAILTRDMLVGSGYSQEQIDNFEFTFQKLTPDGVENVKSRVIDVIRNTAILDTLSQHCIDCGVANGKSFGCFGKVNYPISANCENWLAKLVLDSYNKEVYYPVIIRFILEQDSIGNLIADIRNQGEIFIELRKPVEIKLGKGLFPDKSINTDQILHMLFGFSVMESSKIFHILTLFGSLYSSETKPNDRPSILYSEKNLYVYYGWDLPEDADHSIIDCYNLLHHMLLALTNGCDISFDR